MPQLTRFLTEHPQSLGMSWAGHAGGAIMIGVRMIGAGLACMIHALLPALFTETAGRTIVALHDHMVSRRAGAANPHDWPEYEI